jgi:hypothetical protein
MEIPSGRLWGGHADDARIGGQRPSQRSFAFAPDGRSIVYAATDGDVRGDGPAGSERCRDWPGRPTANRLAVSLGDEERSATNLYLVDPEGRAPRPSDSRRPSGWSWSRTGPRSCRKSPRALRPSLPRYDLAAKLRRCRRRALSHARGAGASAPARDSTAHRVALVRRAETSRPDPSKLTTTRYSLTTRSPIHRLAVSRL